MKDLIERHTAIDEWKNDFKGYVNALDIPRDDYNGIMAYIDELPSTQPEQRWIPVSERMPDNDESVLISNCHGVTKAWWNGKFWTSIAVKKYMTVTAWMPLPKPYKGET